MLSFFKFGGSDLTNNMDTIKRYKEAYFKEHDVLVGAAVTKERRYIQLFEKKFAAKGFNNLFGETEYILEKLHHLQQQLENDEFCLYNPFCERSRRIESYKKLQAFQTQTSEIVIKNPPSQV